MACRLRGTRADKAAQGTCYAEVSFTAAAHGERLGDREMPLRAVLEGLAHGRADYGLRTGLVLDHSRRRPVERAWATLRLAESYASAGVLAVGLAGGVRASFAPADVRAQLLARIDAWLS